MSRSARSFSRSVKNRQRLPYLIASRVDGTGTAALLSGSKELTLTDNGTGDYTLTFTQAFGQIPVVVVTAVTTNAHAEIFAVSKTAVQIKFFQVADGTTAIDADFHIIILGSDALDAV